MRLSIGKFCVLTFSLIALVYVALGFFLRKDCAALSVINNMDEECSEWKEASHKDKTSTGNSSETHDEIQRIRTIVDRLPELKLPSNLKYGFELIAPMRSNQSILLSMQPAEAETSYHKYIESLQIKCPTKTRLGRQRDGGWDSCTAGPFNLTAPCLVYSIGLGSAWANEWSFDYMVTDKYKCLDMAYDPTIGKEDAKLGDGDRLWFYNAGLGYSNETTSRNWKMKTFGQMMRENGHSNRTIDILKIDIEYNEWVSLETILREDSLRNVKQLMVEFHTMELLNGKPSSSRNYAYYWQILRGLDKIGFKSWHYLDTPSGFFRSVHTGKKLSCCANVYFINAAFIS